MQDNSINIVNIPIGPGSQDEGDMVLDYMKMPSEMGTFDMPVIPEADELQRCPYALEVIAHLQQMLNTYPAPGNAYSMVLNDLPDADLELLNQILGEGEVSIVLDDDTTTRIQETVMAGVWRTRTFDKGGLLIEEAISVADIPEVVKCRAFRNPKRLLLATIDFPDALLNAPSVLAEIHDYSERFEKKQLDEAHVINLSLLPFSQDDHRYLSSMLGVGPVTILSRGYGNCRITSTQMAGVWRIQYFNSTDQLILDTIEVTATPAVACAAIEDIEDSAERLREIQDVLC